MKVRSIKTKIILLTMEIVFFSCIVLGCISVYLSRQTASMDAQKELQLMNTSEVMKINGTISKIEQSVNSFSAIALDTIDDFDRFKTDENYEKQCTESMKIAACELQLNTIGAINGYIRYNPEFTNPTSGLFVTSTDGKIEYLPPTDFSMYDPSDTAHVGWYYLPVQAGEPIWMDPYLNENIGVYMISYVVPLFKGDTSLGIVGMDVNFTEIEKQVEEAQVFDTGFAYLVNKDNQIMYYKGQETGTALAEVDASADKILSDTANEGKVMKAGDNVLTYQTLGNGMKYVTIVPDTELNSASNKLTVLLLLSAVICMVISVLYAAIESARITKPIAKLTDIIKDTSNFNFTNDAKGEKLRKLRNEVGVMANATYQMRIKLGNAMDEVAISSEELHNGVQKLKNSSDMVNSMAENNNALTQEVVAAMEQTCSTTEDIKNNIDDVSEKAVQIDELSQDGQKMSLEVKERAERLELSTQQSAEKTRKMYENVRASAELALEKSKAVEKINTLTSAIGDISSQTSLLALNASIEAARAGEAGKGFSVVASEIGTLSNQTANTVENIESIVQEVNEAVSQMSKCLDVTMEFMGETVLADYEEFSRVGAQYKVDATNIEDSMYKVYEAISALNDNIQEISASVDNIAETIEHSSEAVNEIAEKTVDMRAQSNENISIVEDSQQKIEKLYKIVDMFNGSAK